MYTSCVYRNKGYVYQFCGVEQQLKGHLDIKSVIDNNIVVKEVVGGKCNDIFRINEVSGVCVQCDMHAICYKYALFPENLCIFGHT